MPSLADRYRTSGAWRGDTIWQAFAETATRQPEHIYLVEAERRLSFSDAVADVDRLAAGLAGLGVRGGDVVAFQLPNWIETALVFLACARLGAVAHPCLPAFQRRELEFVLGESRARVLLVAGVRDDLPAVEHVIVVRGGDPGAGRSFESLLLQRDDPPPPATGSDAVALLMYTSGSTADPKGVRHSHDTLLAEARSLGPVHGLSSADVTLMPSPLTHISGLIHAVLVPSVFGSTAILMDRWDPHRALELITRERVTYMVGAPTFLRDLAQHPDLPHADVSSFRLFSCGGADVDPSLVREAAARLGCIAKRVYGSTEFPTITTTGPDDPAERRIDSDGRPIGLAEIRLLDDGEVLARGPELFLGYQNPSLNAEAFTADGWFRTGDLGDVDADGYLRITGRKKDIIIRKGENISAREVEELITTHTSVAEVAVVGVRDAVAGEIACAVLRIRPGATAPDLAELCQFLLDAGLSKRKLPERLETVTDFPRTDSGKILKRAVRDRLNPGA